MCALKTKVILHLGMPNRTGTAFYDRFFVPRRCHLMLIDISVYEVINASYRLQEAWQGKAQIPTKCQVVKSYNYVHLSLFCSLVQFSFARRYFQAKNVNKLVPLRDG